MKKKELQHDNNNNNKDLQIIKAVAQAWYSHSGNSGSANEFDACPRGHFKAKPSRFKLEAMSCNPSPWHRNKDSSGSSTCSTPDWDFSQSLWDSYELVTMAKKLDTALVLDDPFPAAQKRPKESKNSLRNLLKRVSSKRFSGVDISSL